MCPFCLDTKKVKVYDDSDSRGDYSLTTAVEAGLDIVELDCPFCIELAEYIEYDITDEDG
jgi:hypothetical protein